MVHPSLHESGGWVSLEAMAAGVPVICLDLGGLALQVNARTGFKISARSPEQAVADMAAALRRVAQNTELAATLGAAAREHVARDFTWATKARVISEALSEAASRGAERL